MIGKALIAAAKNSTTGCESLLASKDKGLSKTFVAIDEAKPTQICAYYALTLAELENRHLPDAWRKKLPRRIPGVRLSRLAVNQAFQNRLKNSS